MKYWVHVIVILVLGVVLLPYLPWWSIAVIAAISSLLLQHKFWMAAMFGFMGGVLLWGGLSFYLDVENHHILSTRMGEVLGGISSTLLIVLTGFIGGLIVALGSVLGAAVKEVTIPKK